MHLISATLTDAAFEIRSRWPSRQKSANISKAVVFYEEHGPSNLDGLWQQNHEMMQNIRGLQREIQRLVARSGTDGPRS